MKTITFRIIEVTDGNGEVHYEAQRLRLGFYWEELGRGYHGSWYADAGKFASATNARAHCVLVAKGLRKAERATVKIIETFKV